MTTAIEKQKVEQRKWGQEWQGWRREGFGAILYKAIKMPSLRTVSKGMQKMKALAMYVSGRLRHGENNASKEALEGIFKTGLCMEWDNMWQLVPGTCLGSSCVFTYLVLTTTQWHMHPIRLILYREIKQLAQDFIDRARILTYIKTL